MATQPEYLDSSVSTGLFATRISISASPSPQQLLGCASASYTVTVPAQTGVTGTLTLSVSGLPAGATASFSPATLANSGSSTLTVNTSTSTPAGTYPLTITVSNATLGGSTNVSLVVQDFNIATTAASQTVTAGGIASYSLSGSVVNGFAGIRSINLKWIADRSHSHFYSSFICRRWQFHPECNYLHIHTAWHVYAHRDGDQRLPDAYSVLDP
jgi:hypothetical protein